MSKRTLPEKVVTVPVSWMLGKEERTNQHERLSHCMSRHVYKQKSVASSIFHAMFKIIPLFLLHNFKKYKNLQKVTKTYRNLSKHIKTYLELNLNLR